MDNPGGDPRLIAWAAGLYDGEGSCSAYLPRRRKTYRRQMAVSQGGDPSRPPLVLIGFQSAVGGVGNLTGPYRGYLFYWKTTRIGTIDNVATTLWPFLGQEKREQFLVASRLGRRELSLDRVSLRATCLSPAVHGDSAVECPGRSRLAAPVPGRRQSWFDHRSASASEPVGTSSELSLGTRRSSQSRDGLWAALAVAWQQQAIADRVGALAGSRRSCPWSS